MNQKFLEEVESHSDNLKEMINEKYHKLITCLEEEPDVIAFAEKCKISISQN